MAPSRAALTSLSSITRQAPKAIRIGGRPYHSYDHAPPPGPFNETERAILSAAYAHVPEHGFTSHALSFGARDAGYRDISTTILPDGPFSLIKYHLVIKREALAPKSADICGAEENAASKVERLTWERLVSNKAVIHRWQEALAIMAQPSYVPPSLQELALLADEIYHLSGDKSVDPSWYAKRGSLSAIFVSAELFMTNDRTFGFDETRAFLQRRLDESKTAAGVLGGVRQWVGFTTAAGVNVLRSKGVRI